MGSLLEGCLADDAFVGTLLGLRGRGQNNRFPYRLLVILEAEGALMDESH